MPEVDVTEARNEEQRKCFGHDLRTHPSVPIIGETTASWFITVEGKEVDEG